MIPFFEYFLFILFIEMSTRNPSYNLGAPPSVKYQASNVNYSTPKDPNYIPGITPVP
jgi:hypothetical protein